MQHSQHFISRKAAAAITAAIALTLATTVAMAAKEVDVGTAAKAQPAAASAQVPGEASRWEKSFPAIASAKWTGPTLPDGQPDVSGFWSNTIANHNNFTDPQGGVPNDPKAKPDKGPREERAPSRVSDPPDGQVPFQPWALQKVKEFQVGFHNPVTQNFVEPLARCAPAGIPKSLYWHGYEVKQYPGYVLFLFESGTRIVHLDNKPHLPSDVKLWNGDSRGHWEGNTLVVDVTNHNGKALFGRSGEFISENGHIVERYIFSNDGKRYNYVATFTDPTVYTRPFTVTVPARRYTEQDEPVGWHFKVEHATHAGKEVLLDKYETTCVENNGGFGLGAASASRPR
ncbi:MAG TPA: hypothetical protein VMH83_00495 [Candidatus Acidoferrum sp.]|nr:hypothetical protein [Candidatus Acidoferrum sp.]